MPLVGVNNEPLLERAIFGFDGTSYRVVKVDTDGNLVAAIKASQSIEVTQDTAADLKATVNVAAAQEIEVTQPTAADLNATVTIPTGQDIEARAYGWIGSAWQKNPLLVGYQTVIDEDLAATATTTSIVVSSTTVPANEVHYVDRAALYNATRANGSCAFDFHKSSGAILRFYYVASLAKNVPLTAPYPIILSSGDFLRWTFNGTQNGDVIVGGLSGYSFETDL